MRRHQSLSTLVVLLCAWLTVSSTAFTASVSSAAEEAAITLVAGETLNHPLKAAADRINVGSSGIVSLYMPEPTSLTLTGDSPGFTVLTIEYPDGSLEQLDVRVWAAHPEVVERLVGELESSLAGVRGVKVKQADDRILLTGSTDAKGLAYCEQLAGMFEGIVVNQVRIGKPRRTARSKSSSTRAKISEYLADQTDVEIRQVGSKVVLAGFVDLKDEPYYKHIVGMFESDIIDLVEFKGQQDSVQVDVQVVEVLRGNAGDLGIQWFSDGPWRISASGTIGTSDSNGGGVVGVTALENINFQLITLAEEGKARFLATPKLVVQSGKEANLLVGGELPIAQSTGLASSVEWKKFGTQLKIAPTIIDEHAIGIELHASVSEFDFSQQVQGYPTLLSREASTRLKVNHGETFAIAGLFTNHVSQRESRVPILGSIPGLGFLFKRQKKESKYAETIVFFTPRILRENVLTEGGVPESLSPSADLEHSMTTLEQAE